MKEIKNVSIIDWKGGSRIFMREPFRDLGFECILYDPQDPLPADTDLFFSFGFFVDFFQFLNKYKSLPVQDRPPFIHWNTEGIPDLRFPKSVSKWGGIFRSAIARKANRPDAGTLYQLLNKKAQRFRYLGDYLYAFRNGLMHSFFDSSEIYVDKERSIGLPAIYVPWGTFRSDFSTLNLERDIDILWMGKPRGKRRNNLVKLIKSELTKFGKKMVVIDGIEHPYVYGDERVRLFNRSKITLNLLPAWDAYNYIFKFHIAAGNRSLLISEPFLNHNSEYIENRHYISARTEDLVATLIYYCDHEEERKRITENAYQLVTNSMTMTQCIKKILSESFHFMETPAAPYTIAG